MKTIKRFIFILIPWITFAGVQHSIGQSMADSSTLKQAVDSFMSVSDRGDVSALEKVYDPAFENVRVTDQDEMITLSRAQLLYLLKSPGRPVFPTRSTTIHRVEVEGGIGFVVLTRVKDLGNGWEPMFYDLIWKNETGKWLLLREFVHQKSMPVRR